MEGIVFVLKENREKWGLLAWFESRYEFHASALPCLVCVCTLHRLVEWFYPYEHGLSRRYIAGIRIQNLLFYTHKLIHNKKEWFEEKLFPNIKLLINLWNPSWNECFFIWILEFCAKPWARSPTHPVEYNQGSISLHTWCGSLHADSFFAGRFFRMTLYLPFVECSRWRRRRRSVLIWTTP